MDNQLGACCSYCNWCLFLVLTIHSIRFFFTLDFNNLCLRLFLLLAYVCLKGRESTCPFEYLYVLLFRVVPGVWGKNTKYLLTVKSEWVGCHKALFHLFLFWIGTISYGHSWNDNLACSCLPPLPETTSSSLNEKYWLKFPDLSLSKTLTWEREQKKPNPVGWRKDWRTFS